MYIDLYAHMHILVYYVHSVNGTGRGRKVWKHDHRQNYIYLWDWGVNSGMEWMVGHSYNSPVRGIRSFGGRNVDF